MKTKSIIVVIVLIISFVGGNAQNEEKEIDFSKLKGPYLGQKPPGMKPELFASGIISLDESFERRFLVWDNGAKVLLMRGNEYFESEIKNKQWTTFKQTDIFGDNEHLLESISPDANKIFFNKFKLNPNVKGREGMESQIWMIEKNGTKWGLPRYLNINGTYPYSDKSGNLYYTISTKMCLGISYYQNNKYDETVVIPASLCTGDKAFAHPCVDPDGKWIIFNTEGNNYTENGSRMFISFKTLNNKWTEPISMGSYIKGSHLITVSTDGKYLFYDSKGDIYWVSTKIIEELKPKDLK